MRQKKGKDLVILLPMVLCILVVLGVYQYNSYFTLFRTPAAGKAIFSIHEGAVRSVAFQTSDGERVELTEEDEVHEAVEAINALQCEKLALDQPVSDDDNRAFLVEMTNGTTQIFYYGDGYVEIRTSLETCSRCACDTSALDVFFQRAGIKG